MTAGKSVAILCAVALLMGSVPPPVWAQNGASSTKTKISPAKKGVKKYAPAKKSTGTADGAGTDGSAPVKKSPTPAEGETLGVDSSTVTGNEPAIPGKPEESEVQTSTGTAAGINELNAALSDMNYKLEIMQERYLKLNQDIEDLRTADRDQRRLLNEQILLQVDPKKIDSIEAEIAVVRSDLAQAREEIALISKDVSERAPHGGEGKKDFSDIIRSPWIAVSALGLSLIAILVRH